MEADCSPQHDTLPAHEWLLAWPQVRQEIQQLLATYRARHPAYDPHWTEGLLEDVDYDVTNLRHRVQWLADHQEQAHHVG